MLKIKIGTFNCENLFFRYRLLDDIPRPFKPAPKVIDFSKMSPDFKKLSEKVEGAGGLDKISKSKESFESFLATIDNKAYKSLLIFMMEGSFIDRLKGVVEDIEPISHTQRSHTGMVIHKNEPNVIGVQEVESLPVLKQFYHKFISKFHKMDYQMLIDGNDYKRGIDVGILSDKDHPITRMQTHQFDTVPDHPNDHVFSRDCAEYDIELSDGQNLTIYVNHLKSQIGGGKQQRLDQTNRIKEILQQRFGNDVKGGHFVVIGDMNCEPDSDEMRPLLDDLKLVNVVKNLDVSEQWTHLQAGYDKKGKLQVKGVSQLDYILLSPSLAGNNHDISPTIERRGLVHLDEITKKLKKKNEKIAEVYDSPKRFKGVGDYGTEASDHCGVFVDLLI